MLNNILSFDNAKIDIIVSSNFFVVFLKAPGGCRVCIFDDGYWNDTVVYKIMHLRLLLDVKYM